MPSHLASPTTGRSTGAAGGGATRAGTAEPATRRELRRSQGGASSGPRLPAVPLVAVVLPDVEALLAADDDLGGADLVSPRSGRRRAPLPAPSPGAAPPAPRAALRAAHPAPRPPRPSSTPAPAAVAHAATAPAALPRAAGTPVDRAVPLTRREARALTQAPSAWGLEGPAGPVTPGGTALGPQRCAGPEPVLSGRRTALAEREPAMSVPLHFTAELELNGLLHRPGAPDDLAPDVRPLVARAQAPVEQEQRGEVLDPREASAAGPLSAGRAVIALPDTPVVGLSQPSRSVPAGDEDGPEEGSRGGEPATVTRRARREIELLEQALALPAAGVSDDRDRHLRTVSFSPVAAPGAAAPEKGAVRSSGRSAFGLPQAGMVGVLGLAALVGPALGQVAHAGTPMTTVPASATAAPTPIGAVADLPLTAPAGSPAIVTPPTDAEGGIPDAASLLAEREAAEQASRASGERAAAAEATAKLDAERDALVATLAPGCTGEVSARAMSNGNGLLDTADLCDLWDGEHQLRPDAALAMARLDLAFREAFGEDISISDAYRTYGSQVAVRAQKPALAARPGTSLHGWGVAVDLGGGISSGGERYQWLMEHAGEYGWENPAWARPGGGGAHEPWHWEFIDGRHGPTTTDTHS